MGKRGPKPSPTVLKLARGNPGKRPVNAEEPDLEAAALQPPKGLPKPAAAVWRRLVNELVTKGVLTVGDTDGFRRYCVLVATVERYEKLIAKVGDEAAISLGYANQLLKNSAQMKQYMETLGLTPTSRSGVKAVRSGGLTAADQKRKRFFGTGDGKPAQA